MADERWLNTRWWLEDTPHVHNSLFGAFEQIERRDDTRLDLAIDHARLYDGSDIQALGHGHFYPQSRAQNSRIAMNIIRSITDTLIAKVIKNKPVPRFVTEFGDPGKQRQAENLTRYLEGVFYQCDVSDIIAPSVLLDAMVQGDGFAKVFNDGKNICIERPFPWEIYVDQIDGTYGKPRAIYQQSLVDKQVLIEAWPEMERVIEDAARKASKTGTSRRRRINRDTLTEQVLVIEAWRLADSKPGRHVIAVETGQLNPEDDEWTRPRFPFARMQFARRQAGYWGKGVAEILTGRQFEVNLLLQKIQETFAVHARPILVAPRGSKIQSSHLTDEIDTMLEYNAGPGGGKPELLTFPLFPPEFYQHLRELVRGGYEEIGVSLLSATGRKPPGLDAAVAQREQQDIESERFLPVGRMYERWHMDLGRLILDESKEMGDYKVRTADRREMLELNFSELNLKDDAYVMKMFPSSWLPNSPAGKMQMVKEMEEAGWLEKQDSMRLIDMPDLDMHKALKFSPYDIVDRMLDEIAHDGARHSPEPGMPLQWAQKRADEYKYYKQMQGLQEDRLDLIQAFSDECVRLMADAMPPPAGPPLPGPAQLPPGVMPEGPPGAPPGPPPPPGGVPGPPTIQ